MNPWLKLFAVAISLFAFAGSGAAQDYPNKPVRLIVGYAPGGTPDVMARVIGERLSKAMGQAFVVENKPGAGAIPATEFVARAAADGYTLLVADIGQLAITPFLFKKVPFDPIKDFAPISMVASTPLFIAVNPSLNVTTFQDLVARAKKEPGKFSYGSAGIGSIHHISMESLKHELGVDIVHVPYKGSGQSVPAFMAGDVTVLAGALPALLPAIQGNKAKLLAVTSSRRFSTRSDIPTVAETMKGYEYPSEVGFLAPAGTPPAIINRLATEINKQLKDPEVIKRLEALGSDAVGTTPAEYAENLRRNMQKYEKAVKISGAKVE
jgi:tripartite-type tricarboxylate transporter receptor subunit TctC